MATCEKCGVTFEPSKDVVEVTSLRVLCPSCFAARQAAKAAKTAVPVSQTAAVASAAPAAARPSPASPHPAPPAKPVAAKPAAVPAKPAPARVARAPKKHRIDASTLESHELSKKQGRSALIGFIVAVVILAVAGVTLWKVMGIHKSERDVQAAYQAKLDKFREDFQAIDISNEEGANRLVAFVDLEENQALWKAADYAPDVVSRRAKAKTFLEQQAERQGLLDRLSAIENALAQAATIAPAELAEQRRRIEELIPKADFLGAEFPSRMKALRDTADKTYVERLKTEATNASHADPMSRQELSKIQFSEDEVLKIYEAAYRLWDKNKSDAALGEKKSYYEGIYRSVMSFSDTAVGRFFTAEEIEKTPWTDLLSGEQASNWAGEAVKGFERRIENGVMHLIGPDPSVGSEAIISVGDREQWRDFLIDIEFTIVKGKFTVFMRLPRSWQENVELLELSTAEGLFTPGESCAMWLRMVGSTFAYEIRSEDSNGPESSPISWTQVRKGAIGLSIPKNSEVKITRLRIKALR
jgi:hypothetical protein